MNTAIKAAVLLSFALAPFAGFSQSSQSSDAAVRIAPVGVTYMPEDYETKYLASFERGTGSVFPIYVETPRPSPNFSGEKVTMRFTVNPDGVPINVRQVAGHPDPSLGMIVGNSIRNWRFSPQIRDGIAVRQDVLVDVLIGQQPASRTPAPATVAQR